MAVNLLATAKLNTAPYMAGLKTMQAGTSGLHKAEVAGSAKATGSVVSDQGKKVAASRLYTQSTKEAAKASIAADKAASRTSSAVAQGLSSQRYLFHDLSRQMAMYSVGLAAPTIATVAAAAKWEDAFANVRRTADPAFSGIETKVQDLRKSLVGMVQSMPTSFADVTEIATLGNQMGVASDQIADFTRATAMFSATSGVSVEQSATAFGRLTSIMGDNAIGFNEMADSILKVGVNSVATEGEIINVTTQISSIAAGAKFSTEEMIGLSGALASVRVPPELSRGLVTRVFGQFDKAVSGGGAQLDTLARLSGRTAEQFKQDWTGGGGGQAFTDFLKGIKKAGPDARKEIESLGIKSVRDVPVLLRLANAADSDGVAGGLLTQTMKDAQNAAGETQRQYSIMADTIWAKIKVLGNNVVSTFDAIGQSNVGPLGSLLDSLTGGIRDFTNSLDEPIKLLGMFELPWTNSQALGLVTNLGLVAAGLTLVGSAALKIGAGAVGLKQLASVMSGGALAPWLTGVKGSARSGVAGNIAAGTAAAAASRPVLNSMKTGAIAAGTAWANLGRRIRIAGDESRRGVSLGPLKYVQKDIPPVTGALGNLTRFGLHPATLAVGALTTAGVMLMNDFFGDSTPISEFSQQLASIDTTDVKALSRELESLEVSGLSQTLFSRIGDEDSWKSTIKPFKNGVSDVKNVLSELTTLREDSTTAWGTVNDVVFADRINKSGLRASADGLKTIDASIQNLVDAGNKGAAVGMLRNLAKSGKDLETFMAMDEGKAAKSLVDSMFAASDFEKTSKNIDKLARGDIPKLTDAYLGAAGITKTMELFDFDDQEAAKYQEVLDKASSAFIDFGKTMSEATLANEDGSFAGLDFTAFSKGMAESVLAQESWQSDMEVIARNTTTGVVKALAEMGPEAADQVGAIADALSSKDPEMQAAGKGMIEALESGANAQLSGFGGTIGQVMADQKWLRQSLGDAGFADFISESLTGDQLSSLRQAGMDASKDVISGVMDGLAGGTISLDQALESLEWDVPVDTHIRNNEAAKGLQDLVAEKFDVDVPVDLTTDSAVGKLKALVNDPALNKIQMNSDLSLADAYRKIPEFKAWADDNGIVIDVDAETSGAGAKVDDLNNKAAEPKTKPVDADTKPANGKLSSLGDLIQEPKTTPVDADVSSARAEINSLNGIHTQSSHSINITETRTYETHGTPFKPASPFMKREADGGSLEFFANGGVRENHVAQIAPAGTMRLWAEPETGGEAYIPLADSKRKRSLAILSDVADRFGVGLTSDVAKFANGGQYQSQQMSRNISSVRNGGAAAGMSISDREFFAHLFREVVVTADSQAITSLTNSINSQNSRFGR